MKKQKVSEDILLDSSNITTRFFNLVIGRVLRRVYSDLDQQGKEKIEKVFLSDDGKAKEKFIKKYIPNFKKIFEEEAKKIEEEIEAEIGK
jgi:hypothetical protein